MNIEPEHIPSGPGRMDKHAAILEAATNVFLRAGYGAATMDVIAREAGVAKQTVYHHFGSKEALFGAIIRMRSQGLLDSSALDSGGDVRTTLRRLARNVLDVALSPSSLALHRLIIAESARFPEIGRVVYRESTVPSIKALADFLRSQSARGALTIGDPRIAAEQFFGLILGLLQVRRLLDSEATEPFEMHAWIDHAIGTFAGRAAPTPA